MAQKYGVYDLLKLSHKVEEARWDGAKWQVTVRDLATETVFVEEADYVLTAIGRFNAWRLPNYPGLNDFRGLLRHASHYEPTFDPERKEDRSDWKRGQWYPVGIQSPETRRPFGCLRSE